MPEFDGSLLGWFVRSEGVFFWVQLVLAVWTCTLVIANTGWLITRRSIVPKALARELRGRIEEGNRQAAQALLRRHDSELAEVVRNGMAVVFPEASREHIREEVLDECDRVEARIERRLGHLALFAQVNMLVGLLGTVWGLVTSFQVIGASESVPKASELAGGVSQALLTTIVGLVLAIPSLAAYSWLRGRAGQLLVELEQTAQRLLELYWTTIRGQRREARGER